MFSPQVAELHKTLEPTSSDVFCPSEHFSVDQEDRPQAAMPGHVEEDRPRRLL